VYDRLGPGSCGWERGARAQEHWAAVAPSLWVSPVCLFSVLWRYTSESCMSVSLNFLSVFLCLSLPTLSLFLCVFLFLLIYSCLSLLPVFLCYSASPLLLSLSIPIAPFQPLHWHLRVFWEMLVRKMVIKWLNCYHQENKQLGWIWGAKGILIHCWWECKSL
jgi:hypothetical protein